MSKPYQLVLASTSSYRKIQLSQLTDNFRCVAPNIDETPREGEKPEQLSARLALAKARSAAEQLDDEALVYDALIIGADQCAALGGEILGKPLTAANARAQLARCSGQQVRFFSGLCVLNKTTGEALCDTVVTVVRFRHLSEQEIASYILKEHVLDCAGSFKCEGLGIALFNEINSNDPSALVGLPLIQLNRFLLHFGVNTLLN